MVYVINKDGQPLMPTERHGKVKHLLRSKQAKVVKRCPFTIQLLVETTNYVQEVSLGIDAGTKNIGVSATTEDKVLFEGTVLLRDDIKKLIAARSALRKSRRNRKLRYRQARFLNRKKPQGWLAPSVENKIATHIKTINMLHSILPIAKQTIEVAQFDTQKIKNPDINGDMYQQGDQLGFWNVREYVFTRDEYTCQCCKGKKKDPVLQVHHIESRQTGGNSPGNLITLCKTCHKEIHAKGLEHTIERSTKSLRDATQMTIMRWFLYNRVVALYPETKLMYGFMTKNTRIQNGLAKSHEVDARCISGNPLAAPAASYYILKQVRKNNRQLHKMNPKKGVRKSNQAPRFVHGFQLFDKVSLDGVEGFIFGRRATGYFDVRTLQAKNNSVHKSASYKKLKLLDYGSTLLIQEFK